MKIIRCEEVVTDSVIVTLNDIQVDVARISAYNTIKMMKLIVDVSKSEADPTTAYNIILDIIREQGGDITEDDILKAGNHDQLRYFVQTIAEHVVKTYAPIKKVVGPFEQQNPETTQK